MKRIFSIVLMAFAIVSASAQTKKVSILGDSYSTFQGVNPEGYNPFYPNDRNDVKEVSTLLDLSSSEVYQMIRRGEIQTFRCGRQLRVPREELENWLKDLKKDIKQHKER